MLPPPYEAQLTSDIVEEVLIRTIIQQPGSGEIKDWLEQAKGMRKVLGEMEKRLDELVAVRIVEDGMELGGVLGLEEPIGGRAGGLGRRLINRRW